MVFVPNPKITKYIGVSKVVCKHFEEITGLKAELCYNPIIVDKPKRVLRLISATRLSLEKGKQRMIRLGQILDKANIPYIWLIFTNDIRAINNPNIIYMQPRLDITNYIASSDYLVQLSNNGEGFGYTPCEALMVNTPVIVTPCDSFYEIGVKDGYNGFIVPFDMEGIDINKIYNTKLKFDYEPPKDNWNKLLGRKKTDYINDYDKKVKVKVRSDVGFYYDKLLDKYIYVQDGAYEVNVYRARQLLDANVCELVEEKSI